MYFFPVVFSFSTSNKYVTNLKKCMSTQGAILTTMLATRNFSGMLTELQAHMVFMF